MPVVLPPGFVARDPRRPVVISSDPTAAAWRQLPMQCR
jgi:hypothetical protein